MAPLGVDADGEFVERAPGSGEGEAVVAGGHVLLPAAGAAGEAVEAEGEAWGEAVVVVEVETEEILVVGGEREGGGGAVGPGGLRRGVENAAGAAEAEEDGVGAAGLLEALGVEGVGDEGGAEIIARARSLLAAHAELEAAGVDRDALGAGGLIGAFGHGRRGVAHEVGLAEGVEVGDELGGEDRDGVGDVGEIRAEARAGEGVVGEVADVLVRRDGERGEDDGVVGPGGGSRGGRGVGREGGEGEREEGEEAHGAKRQGGWGRRAGQ